MKTLAYAALIVLLLYPHGVFGQKKAEYEETRISGLFENVPLSHILENVKGQHGYEVVVPDAWVGRMVSGDFNQISLSNLIKYVVKGRNFSVLIDESHRKIVFQDFGAIASYEYGGNPGVETKEQASEAGGVTDSGTIQGQSGEDIFGTSFPNTSELEELHRAQLEAHEKAMRDPNTIDPETGLTIGYLQSLHEKQLTLEKEYRESPDYIDPFSQVDIEQQN